MIARNTSRSRHTDVSHSIQSILITGTSRQGVSLAADLLCEAAIYAGFDCSVRETHDTDSPQGNVRCTLYLGSIAAMNTPVDLIAALDRDAGQNCLSNLSVGGQALVAGESASRLTDERIHCIDAKPALNQNLYAGGINLYVLGALSQYLPLDRNAWFMAFQNVAPRRLRAASWKMFRQGRKASLSERTVQRELQLK